MSLYLGIDVGLHGALAWYESFTQQLVVEDMPVLSVTVNVNVKNQIDIYKLGWLICSKGEVHKAVVESVSSAPGQGVTSAFSFGFSAGCAQMAVAAQSVPMDLAHPRIWKKVMGVTADKDTSFRAASRLLPKYSYLWARKKDDGRAEAALIALYAAQTDRNRVMRDLL